jgi:hypothetical protein
VTESQDGDFCIIVCTNFWGRLVTYISTSTGFGADVVSGESWELVNAVHVGGDSLILQK